MSREATIKAMLLDKINLLFDTAGIEITANQFQGLLEHYLSSPASLTEIAQDIEQRFMAKLAYYQHQQHRAGVIENYKQGVNPLTENQNCYLVSYNTDGQKVIKPAKLSFPEAPEKGIIIPNKVIINDDPQKIAYRQDSTNNGGAYLDDLEMIYNQIGFMLDINLAKTHRIFNEAMQPVGLLSEDPATSVNERFLSFKELAKIVLEHGTNEPIKAWLRDYFNKLELIKKMPGSPTVVPELYNQTIEFVLRVITGLPQISLQNQNELKQSFFDMKVFEIFSGSIENTSAKYGVVVDTSKTPYLYRFAALFDHPFATNAQMGIDESYLSNSLVNKRELYRLLVTFYFPFIKSKSKMILENNEAILAAIDSIAQDFLDYGAFQEYRQLVRASSQMMAEEIAKKRELADNTLEERVTDATNNEIASSRAQALQRGASVRKAKNHTLTLHSGETPPLILDDNGKVDKRFVIITSCLMAIIIYMLIMVLIY